MVDICFTSEHQTYAAQREVRLERICICINSFRGKEVCIILIDRAMFLYKSAYLSKKLSLAITTAVLVVFVVWLTHYPFCVFLFVCNRAHVVTANTLAANLLAFVDGASMRIAYVFCD